RSSTRSNPSRVSNASATTDAGRWPNAPEAPRLAAAETDKVTLTEILRRGGPPSHDAGPRSGRTPCRKVVHDHHTEHSRPQCTSGPPAGHPHRPRRHRGLPAPRPDPPRRG